MKNRLRKKSKRQPFIIKDGRTKSEKVWNTIRYEATNAPYKH